MHQQDGQAHRNTIPAINIETIWLRHNGADKIKDKNFYQDRKDEFIGGADASTVRAGA